MEGGLDEVEEKCREEYWSGTKASWSEEGKKIEKEETEKRKGGKVEGNVRRKRGEKRME